MRQGTTRDWVSPESGSVGALPLANVALALAAFLGLLLVVLIVSVVGVQMVYAGRMYPGVRALGVPIGGLSRDEATAVLRSRAAELVNRQITIGFQELRWTVFGYHLGVRDEIEPVVEEAYSLGREGNLLSRFLIQTRLAFNGSAYEVRAPAYDRARLGELMQALAQAVNRPVTDASLSIQPDGRIGFVEAQIGRRLEVEATERRLADAIVQTDVDHVELVVVESPPTVTSADLAHVRQRAEALLQAPITLKFEESEWQLSVQELAAMTEVVPGDGVRLKQDAVRAWAVKLAGELDQEPLNARFTWSNGSLSVLRPSKDGRDLDVDRTTELIMARAFERERVVPLPVSVTKPEVSQEDGHKLNIQGAIEVARTTFAGSSPPKQHNINLATQRLNGVVVPPGKMFSFNKEVGSTSLDAGYKLGWGIANAGANVKTVPSVAGGICQVATTLFHTVFWSGYQIEERNYHLYWIPGYTSKGVEGLDATVDEEAGLDFRFFNNTEHYLLIQAWTESGRVVFGLYGTKPDWSVKVTPGDRTDVVEASKDQIIEEEPTLPAGQRLAVEGAMDGFKVTNTRVVTRGSDVRTLRLTSSYRPSRNVTLVGTGGRPAGPSQVIPNRPTRPTDATPTTSATPVPTAPANQAATPAARPTSGAGSQPGAPSGNPPAAKPTAAPAPAAPATPTPPAPAQAPAIIPKPVIQPTRAPSGPTPNRAPASIPLNRSP